MPWLGASLWIKNCVSATQVPTQERGKRAIDTVEVAQTQQPVQATQVRRAQSINLRVSKLSRKATKVVMSKTVNNKEVELTSLVFEPVYHQELVSKSMIQKVQLVLDTTYKPYVSNGDHNNNKEPEYYRNVER